MTRSTPNANSDGHSDPREGTKVIGLPTPSAPWSVKRFAHPLGWPRDDLSKQVPRFVQTKLGTGANKIHGPIGAVRGTMQ
jgi:hypothetical protein